MKPIDYKIQILLTIFISSLLLGNLLGGKLVEIFGIVTSVGLFGYPPTFLITDIVEEVKGREVTKIFVHAGFLSLCIALFFIFVSTGLSPPSPPLYPHNEAYNHVFSGSLRIILASMIAFLISQYHDIWAFNFWKKKQMGDACGSGIIFQQLFPSFSTLPFLCLSLSIMQVLRWAQLLYSP